MTTPERSTDTLADEKQEARPDASAQLPLTVIAPSRGWAAWSLRELWAFRELLYILSMRDVKVRYKQAALGVAWAVLRPLFLMVVFTIIFARVAKLHYGDIPAAVSIFAALLPWQLFAEALARSGNSLVGNAGLLTKVYFPRLIIPLSAVFSGIIDFLVSFVVLVGMIAYYHFATSWDMKITWALLALPLFVLLAMLAALAVGLWLAALNVRYRDVGHLIPFIVQAWMYASPVAYTIAELPKHGPWRLLYGLNPMAGVIQGFRWALLGDTFPGMMLAYSVLVTLLLLAGGVYMFKVIERTFADVV